MSHKSGSWSNEESLIPLPNFHTLPVALPVAQGVRAFLKEQKNMEGFKKEKKEKDKKEKGPKWQKGYVRIHVRKTL
jgi:hypothetical protein